MPSQVIKSFEVRWIQVLDEFGNMDESLKPDLSSDDIKKMYEYMVSARAIDDCIFNLQREGRATTYARSIGHEATQVGSSFLLEPSDWLIPYFRDIGTYLVRGFPPHQYIQYWMGDERGMHVPEGLNNFLVCIPVSTQIPQAVGIGWGLKKRGEKASVLCFLGDGATSKGDFHEGMNLAGIFKTPNVFICQNNQWAISVPVSRQTSSETLAQKAFAYGFEGVKVDGNDIFAVYKTAKEAMEKARAGGGPTLIECFTYRMADHTTADDARRYRSDEEVAGWRAKDPVERLKKYMIKTGIWNDEEEKELAESVTELVERSVKIAESLPPADPAEIFDYTYASLPAGLREQKEALLREIKGNEDERVKDSLKKEKKGRR